MIIRCRQLPQLTATSRSLVVAPPGARDLHLADVDSIMIEIAAVEADIISGRGPTLVIITKRGIIRRKVAATAVVAHTHQAQAGTADVHAREATVVMTERNQQNLIRHLEKLRRIAVERKTRDLQIANKAYFNNRTMKTTDILL